MWHKPCRTFHPWCLCIKTRCLSPFDSNLTICFFGQSLTTEKWSAGLFLALVSGQPQSMEELVGQTRGWIRKYQVSGGLPTASHQPEQKFGTGPCPIKDLHWLTHWGRDKTTSMFQTTFSNGNFFVEMLKFRLRFSLNFVPKGPNKYSSTDSDNGLAPTRRQAIIWSNDG